MSTAAFVRNFINKLRMSQIFVTRELLTFGNRSAIDRQIGLMVNKGLIIRLARGVFVRTDEELELPSVEDIARAKARAFGKHLVEHGTNLAREFDLRKNVAEMNPRQLERHEKDEHEFKHSAGRWAVLGCTSSFDTHFGRVHLKHVAAKKYFLTQHSVGRVLMARWHVGLKAIVDIGKLKAQANFNAFKSRQVKELAAWTVGWLNELIRAEPPKADIRCPWTFCPLPVPVYPEYQIPTTPLIRESQPLYRVA